MSKKKKQNFSQFKILYLIGAVGAAVGAAILGFLYFTSGGGKKKDDQDDQDQDDQDQDDQDHDNQEKTDQK